MASDVHSKMQQWRPQMKKLLDKVKKKLISATVKKDVGQKNVKSSRAFPRQKASLK